MPGTSANLVAAAETYFSELARTRAVGGATGELSSHHPLANLLNAVGAALRPKVFCVHELANQGAGRPDFGLYSARQVQKGRAIEGQKPERGVVEVKGLEDDVWLTSEGEQVSRYWARYRLVLVTNTCDFVLVGQDAFGERTKLEPFRLAENNEEFALCLENPRAFARKSGLRLGEYLSRALSHQASLTEPKDLAWLLASYAREGLARVESAGDAPQLQAIRSALEEALGVRFEGARGARFFHSTLVQTLFYGVFSAWVLWCRTAKRDPGPLLRKVIDAAPFEWRTVVWHLRVPVLATLFQQLSQPDRLRPMDLVEVLDWASDALNRVDRDAFFARFDEGEAVPYFYEPFLEAFDPDLRKQLGVWYTPTEVVRYMVARVDRALKDGLRIKDGLAGENVYVLDPCCGTGAYLAEVLRRIAANIGTRGLGGVEVERVKQAATERVFGFEIMPAPFVVAHLQVGLTMRLLGCPLADDGTERAGVFLTNALTGWESLTAKPLPFPELEQERDRAERVKQITPILVILGNPPYNGFAGMAVKEERSLSTAYRTVKRVRRPEGQGLNDLYVRFFRMAERRITQETGRGVVCFISNYSWLDGLSFTGMRERFLEEFDTVDIDCLNGDKYKTGKVAPDGSPDPSIFSTDSDPVGIQVGTAIATLVRKTNHRAADVVGFRNLWGRDKPAQLLLTAEAEPERLYQRIAPVEDLGLPFVQTSVGADWFDWPQLPDLFPVSFAGVKTSRDGFLVDVDLDRLKERIDEYFDAALGHEEIARRYPRVMETTARFDARVVRDTLLRRGGPDQSGFIPFAYRPFDNRWLYWEKDTKLLDEKRADYRPHVFEGNKWLVTQQKPRREWSPPQLISHIGCLDLLDRGATCIPARLWRTEQIGSPHGGSQPNLSIQAVRYLDRTKADVDDLFHHVLATLHDPAYREVNVGALRMEWPRIPLPGWSDGGTEDAAATIAESAARGRELAALLDPESKVPGVTEPPLRPHFFVIAVPETGSELGRRADFAVTARWGYAANGGAVMPGQGRAVERPFTPDERKAMGRALPALGETTFDIYINASFYFRNVPSAVWGYKLGGYQVLKKWLSYREHRVLGRPLSINESIDFVQCSRRIAAILLLWDG